MTTQCVVRTRARPSRSETLGVPFIKISLRFARTTGGRPYRRCCVVLSFLIVGDDVLGVPRAIAWQAASLLRKHSESPLQPKHQILHKPVGVGAKRLQSKLYAERSEAARQARAKRHDVFINGGGKPPSYDVRPL